MSRDDALAMRGSGWDGDLEELRGGYLRLTAAIQADEPLATTGLVALEILAGARDEHQAAELRRLLDRCRFLPLEEPSDHEAAAALYRACRREGTTIRRLPDCLIAAVAIRTHATVLHGDAAFDAIAAHAPLTMAEVEAGA